MKTDAEIRAAIAQGRVHEEACAAYLRSCGLDAYVLSSGFRASREEIADWEHDIDLYVQGDHYQLKYRTVALAGLRRNGWQPFVDERVKADRTKVAGYILRFCDACVVVAYDPVRWDVERKQDESDRAEKDFYTVRWDDWVGLGAWVSGMGGVVA